MNYRKGLLNGAGGFAAFMAFYAYNHFAHGTAIRVDLVVASSIGCAFGAWCCALPDGAHNIAFLTFFVSLIFSVIAYSKIESAVHLSTFQDTIVTYAAFLLPALIATIVAMLWLRVKQRKSVNDGT